MRFYLEQELNKVTITENLNVEGVMPDSRCVIKFLKIQGVFPDRYKDMECKTDIAVKYNEILVGSTPTFNGMENISSRLGKGMKGYGNIF